MTDIALTDQPQAGAGGGRYVKGAENIGREVGLNARQVSYFYRRGLFGKAVQKFGHRTLIGDRWQLRNLSFLERK
jgi:hypothetical protein